MTIKTLFEIRKGYIVDFCITIFHSSVFKRYFNVFIFNFLKESTVNVTLQVALVLIL